MSKGKTGSTKNRDNTRLARAGAAITEVDEMWPRISRMSPDRIRSIASSLPHPRSFVLRFRLHADLSTRVLVGRKGCFSAEKRLAFVDAALTLLGRCTQDARTERDTMTSLVTRGVLLAELGRHDELRAALDAIVSYVEIVSRRRQR